MLYTWRLLFPCSVCFQAPFNVVQLRAIGDDSAPTFFEVTETGQVRIRENANLASDRDTDYKVLQIQYTHHSVTNAELDSEAQR